MNDGADDVRAGPETTPYRRSETLRLSRGSRGFAKYGNVNHASLESHGLIDNATEAQSIFQVSVGFSLSFTRKKWVALGPLCDPLNKKSSSMTGLKPIEEGRSAGTTSMMRPPHFFSWRPDEPWDGALINSWKALVLLLSKQPGSHPSDRLSWQSPTIDLS